MKPVVISHNSNLDYNPDIDREPDSVNAIQPLNADSVKEDTFTGISKLEDHTTICPTTNRSEHQPSEVPSDIQINEHDNAEQQEAEHPSDYHPQLEDIPELKTKKTGMMVSLMMQSFSIITILLRKVTEYIVSTLLTLKKLKINNTALTILHKALNIIFLSQIIIATTHNQNSTRNSKIKNILTPIPLY